MSYFPKDYFPQGHFSLGYFTKLVQTTLSAAKRAFMFFLDL